MASLLCNWPGEDFSNMDTESHRVELPGERFQSNMHMLSLGME